MSKDDPQPPPIQPPADPAPGDAKQTVVEAPASEPKDPAAVALGSRGGKARAKKLDAQQRSDSARKAAKSRWRKGEPDPEA